MMFSMWDFAILVSCIIMALYSQGRVRKAYSTFSQVASAAGISGAETARRLLRENGILDVAVEEVAINTQPFGALGNSSLVERSMLQVCGKLKIASTFCFFRLHVVNIIE